MFVIIFLILGILILVLQTTFLQLLPPWLGKPDILFLLIVYISCQSEILLGAVVIFILGLLTDVFSGVFLGFYPVIYLLVFAFIKGISRRITINELVYQVPLALISYMLVTAGVFLFSYSLEPDIPPQWSWGTIILQLLMLAVIGAPVLGMFDSLMNFYRSISAAGRLPGSKTFNRFK
jgi:rod shape-determining protein MreD